MQGQCRAVRAAGGPEREGAREKERGAVRDAMGEGE